MAGMGELLMIGAKYLQACEYTRDWGSCLGWQAARNRNREAKQANCGRERTLNHQGSKNAAPSSH